MMKLFVFLHSPQILTGILIFFIFSFNIQISLGESQIISRKIRQAAEEETGENTEQQEETGGENSENNSNTDPVPLELDLTTRFVCPKALEKIQPCTCFFKQDGGVSSSSSSKSSTGLRIFCTGPSVTQSSVNKVLQILRETNEPPPDSNYSLYLHQFRIQSTHLTTLDLTSFLRVSVKEMLIQENYNLSTITAPPFPIPRNNNNNNFQRPTTTTTPNPNNPYEVKIQTLFLSFYFNALNEKGFGRALEYFDASSMEKLDLSFNSFTGTSNFLVTGNRNGNNNGNRNPNIREYEFLPGLANLTNLRDLNLGGNKIRRLDSARFKHLVRLENLGLYNNNMEDLSENSLLFDQPKTEIIGEEVNILSPGSISMTPLYIWLYNNKLQENRLANKLGVEKMRRPVNLRLNENKITTIPQAKFQTLLESQNTTITIYLRDNPIMCDKRLTWLKSKRVEFEQKLQNADCKNDRLRNVFTSKLTA